LTFIDSGRYVAGVGVFWVSVTNNTITWGGWLDDVTACHTYIKRDLKPDMTSFGMKPIKYWRQTEQNHFDVWPNAPIWMRDELRSKVRATPCTRNRILYVQRLS